MSEKKKRNYELEILGFSLSKSLSSGWQPWQLQVIQPSALRGVLLLEEGTWQIQARPLFLLSFKQALQHSERILEDSEREFEDWDFEDCLKEGEEEEEGEDFLFWGSESSKSISSSFKTSWIVSVFSS